MIGVIYMWY